MSWEVEASDEFKEWYESLREEERVSVAESVDMLEEYGPALGRPYADTLRGIPLPKHEGTPGATPGESPTASCLPSIPGGALT